MAHSVAGSGTGIAVVAADFVKLVMLIATAECHSVNAMNDLFVAVMASCPPYLFDSPHFPLDIHDVHDAKDYSPNHDDAMPSFAHSPLRSRHCNDVQREAFHRAHEDMLDYRGPADKQYNPSLCNLIRYQS